MIPQQTPLFTSLGFWALRHKAEERAKRHFVPTSLRQWGQIILENHQISITIMIALCNLFCSRSATQSMLIDGTKTNSRPKPDDFSNWIEEHLSSTHTHWDVYWAVPLLIGMPQHNTYKWIQQHILLVILSLWIKTKLCSRLTRHVLFQVRVWTFKRVSPTWALTSQLICPRLWVFLTHVDRSIPGYTCTAQDLWRTHWI